MKLLYNARIYTFDENQPLASALVIDRKHILALGESDALRVEFSSAKSQDMQGGIILPGLTDAHLHLQHYALSLQKVDCETNTLAECLRRIAERANKTPPGEWILGHGWNQNNWDGWPSKADLDKIAPNNPVYLTAKSLHAGWANSAALKLANITANTPHPENGQIQHDAHGQPTGILLETAMELVGNIVPEPPVDTLAEAIEQAQPSLWRLGLTGVHDFDRRACFMALQHLHANGRLKLRVNKSVPIELLPQANELGLRTGFGDDTLWIGSVKAFMDGALGPHTAAMIQPYEDDPANKGILNMDAEELFEQGRLAAEVGLSMAVHAIGDRANHEVLNAFEQLRRFERDHSMPPLRHRIEHVQILHPDDLGRLAALDIIASMQPIHATSDMIMADEYWGERTKYAYAWKTQLEAGARLAFGSDAPVESPNPFWGIHAAITRQRGDGFPNPGGWHPEQRLSMQAAIAGFTTDAAYTAGKEHKLGKLASGYLADLIVLEDDLFDMPPSKVRDLRPQATMLGGEWVFQK
ncbi:MAG: amidohydrolase [Anaerolineales bacterium]